MHITPCGNGANPASDSKTRATPSQSWAASHPPPAGALASRIISSAIEAGDFAKRRGLGFAPR